MGEAHTSTIHGQHKPGERSMSTEKYYMDLCGKRIIHRETYDGF